MGGLVAKGEYGSSRRLITGGMATTAAVPSIAGSSEDATIEAAPDPLLEYSTITAVPPMVPDP